MQKTALSLLGLSAFLFSNSQTVISDSSQPLSEIVIKAYEQNQSLKKVPAAISQVNKTRPDRFSNSNILPALNTNPGVASKNVRQGARKYFTFSLWSHQQKTPAIARVLLFIPY